MIDFERLRTKFNKGLIRSEHLLSECKLLGESSRSSPAYVDVKNIPFYYHLGTVYSPKVVVQYGSCLGLTGAAFMQGSQTSVDWYVYDDSPANIVRANVAMNNIGSTHMFPMKDYESAPDCDMGMICVEEPENTVALFEAMWSKLSDQGLMVVDYITRSPTISKAFEVFCRVKNRTPEIIESRYGIGLLTR